jgi:hypothetical protein
LGVCDRPDMIGQALRMLEPMIEEAIAEAQAQA